MSFRHFSTITWCAVVLVGMPVAVSAQHRVALLICNSAYKNGDTAVSEPDIEALEKALQERGFRCQVLRNLGSEKTLRDAIEGYARRTPTRSTALLYFSGRLSDDQGFLGTDARSRFGLDRTLEALTSRGGSDTHLIFVDAPSSSEFKGQLPGSCCLTFGSTKSLQANLAREKDLVAVFKAAGKTRSSLPLDAVLTGQGSKAISPPDQFVQGKKAGDQWVNSMGIVFCWCPPGSYVSGSPESEPARYPDEVQKQVTIKDGFWLSKYELALSQRIAKRGPGRTIATNKLHPMTMINHDDAKRMTRNFSESERQAGRLASGWCYSLPSENQWEYAARAGTNTRFYFGDDLHQLPKHANFADKTFYDTGDTFSNAAHRTLDDGAAKLALVGSYQPNSWGLHDMYGNVAEWCINGATRGGGWPSDAENCRSAYRDVYSSRNEQNFIGYRIVIQRNPPTKPDKQKNGK